MRYFLKRVITSTLCFISVIYLSACSDPGDTDGSAFQISATTPNQFLTLLNQQMPLSQGAYEIYVLPQNSVAGNYNFNVSTVNNSIDVNYSGTWLSSVDVAWQSTAQAPHNITLSQAGGLNIEASCDSPCEVFLIKNTQLIMSQSSEEVSTTAHRVNVSLEDSGISSVAYANAYYKAVDANSERTTLSDWQTKNSFDQGFDVHVIFRDSKDLGYGRDMYARKNDDGSLAFYVNNFVVSVGKGNPANYGPLNLQAATDQNFDYHLGSNAIEFSPVDENDANSDFVLKFFTFTAKDQNGEQQRITSADLDGRGTKHMPTMCLACHGGNMLPLNPDGSFNTLSLKSAKLNQLEADSFEFLEAGEFSLDEQQAGMKTINEWVRDSFDEFATRDQTEKGYWHEDFAKSIAEYRYGGSDFNATEFIESGIPAGWQQTTYRPEGVETLYKKVVEPHCISCHSLRGYNAGNDVDLDSTLINGQAVYLGNAINFSSYEKFISYADLITDYVYRRGVMPLSLRNYESFWLDVTQAPSLLASFLPNFDVFIKDGNDVQSIVEPGLPVPVIESMRISQSPVLLNADASYFAQSYLWEVLESPSGSEFSLTDSEKSISSLTADTDGPYTLRLTVWNDKSQALAAGSIDSAVLSKEVIITIDSQLAKHGSEYNFVDDIKPLLQTTLYDLRSCQSCHSGVSDVEGIPVHYDNANTQLYEDIKARINLKEPVNSLLLLKPSRLQHGGGIRFDMDDINHAKAYSTILDWALHGAPCGEDVNICGS